MICKCCLWTWAPCHHGRENYFQVYPHILPDNITEALCQLTLSRSWVMQQNNDPKTQVNWLQCIFMKKKFKTWSFSVTLDKSQDLLCRPEYRNILHFKVHEGGKKLMSQYIIMIPDCVKFWLKFEDIFKDIWWYAVRSALVYVFSLHLLIQVFLQLSTSCPWLLDNPSYHSFQCCVWHHLVVASLLAF